MKTLQSLCSHVRLAGLLLFAALIIGCVSDKDKAWLELEEAVEKEAKALPQQIEEGMLATEIKLNDDMLVMTFSVTSDDEYMTPEMFRSNRETFKSAMLSAMQNDTESRHILELCKAAEVQMKIVLKFPHHSQTVEVVVPVNEIDEALQGTLAAGDDNSDSDSLAAGDEEEDEVEQARTALRGQMPTMRSQLPMVIEDGMTWTGVSYDGDNVTYVYTMDEEKIGGSVSQAYEGQQALLKNNIKVNFQGGDNTVKAFLQTCIQAGSGLIYSFVGDTTGESVSVRFKPSELANLL